MHRFLKTVLILCLAPIALLCGYLFLALIGGIIPASLGTESREGETIDLYLTGTLLHTDIAIPVTPDTKAYFSFLAETEFPLNTPALKYFVVGWGSQAFYTQTADYSDIAFSTTWKAITGDDAVLHIGPAQDLEFDESVTKVTVDREGLMNLLKFIDKTLKKNGEKPDLLIGATFGFGDVFYKAHGNFNIFNPCNVWLSGALREAGLPSGIWTPTSYSVALNLWVYG